jgi:hypothetical protein
VSPEIQRVLEEFAERKLQVLPETANEQWNEERKLVQRYAERELFELVQNALDRAEDRVVLVQDAAGGVFVGNNGQPVSVTEQSGSRPRNDFEGLLSVNTSRKKAWEAIGNKGVGFKSVFGASSTVEVWSCHPSEGWWGFRLRHPFRPEHAWSPAIRAFVEALPQRAAPSFYFPEPLPTRPWLESPLVRDNGLVTVVHLCEPRRDLVAPFEAFRQQQLYFVAARYPSKRTLRVVQLSEGAEPAQRGIDLPADWGRHPEQPLDIEGPEVRRLAEAAGLEFKWEGQPLVPPRLQLAFPPPGERPEGLYWSFLPTRQACPFPVQLHGDFLLTDDRTRLQDRCDYNAHLLRRVPELLDQAQASVLAPREDLWTFLTPTPRSRPPASARPSTPWRDRGLPSRASGAASRPGPAAW